MGLKGFTMVEQNGVLQLVHSTYESPLRDTLITAKNGPFRHFFLTMVQASKQGRHLLGTLHFQAEVYGGTEKIS